MNPNTPKVYDELRELTPEDWSKLARRAGKTSATLAKMVWIQTYERKMFQKWLRLRKKGLTNR